MNILKIDDRNSALICACEGEYKKYVHTHTFDPIAVEANKTRPEQPGKECRNSLGKTYHPLASAPAPGSPKWNGSDQLSGLGSGSLVVGLEDLPLKQQRLEFLFGLDCPGKSLAQ